MTMNRRDLLSQLGVAVGGLAFCAAAPLLAEAAHDKTQEKYDKLVEDLGGSRRS